jgi:hypothetical protein
MAHAQNAAAWNGVVGTGRQAVERSINGLPG